MNKKPNKRLRQTVLFKSFKETKVNTFLPKGVVSSLESSKMTTTPKNEPSSLKDSHSSSTCKHDLPSSSHSNVESCLLKDSSLASGHQSESYSLDRQLDSQGTQETVCDENVVQQSLSPTQCLSTETTQHDSKDSDSKGTSSPPTGLSLGIPIEQLKRATSDINLPNLEASDKHTILFKLPYKYSDTSPPDPHSRVYDPNSDLWDMSHVKMPYSHFSEYSEDGQPIRRWSLIEKALRGNITNTEELKDAILSYNTRYENTWDFSALHRLFLEVYDVKDTKWFFDVTLKRMISLALQLPHLCTKPLPMLQRGQSRSITFSQQQIASLLANAFFCTFPRRNSHHRQSEYANYPFINFNGLYSGGQFPHKIEKLKCIVHYFTRVTTQMPTGVVTYHRQVMDKFPEWSSSQKCFGRVHISTHGMIEDAGERMLQIDFANKFLGGGALRHGCVQEEIRFMICPELILSTLFTEVLDRNECLIMTGCERFSNYSGYANSFTWVGNHLDKSDRDKWGRLLVEVVAIDALHIRKHLKQFESWAIDRELNKAYCGFYNSYLSVDKLPSVCTGNWGCGAFRGDKQLKAILQLMAAAEAGRDVLYLTFQDTQLCSELYDIWKLLANTRICDCYLYLSQYNENVCHKSQNVPLMTLFDYICSCLLGDEEGASPSSFPSDSQIPGQLANTIVQ